MKFQMQQLKDHLKSEEERSYFMWSDPQGLAEAVNMGDIFPNPSAYITTSSNL
jgi:hypothetical protein